MKIILASSSPRRKQILKEAGFEFDILHMDTDETFSPDMLVEDVPLFIAQKKMLEAKKKCGEDVIIITADTVVVLEKDIIGKPIDKEHAVDILEKLSGKMHLVISGVCVHSPVQSYEFTVTTKVFFETLSDKEIQYYLNAYKPFDKAGAYAIQEWIGINKISKIEGDYYNVVGFPMSKIYPILISLQ